MSPLHLSLAVTRLPRGASSVPSGGALPAQRRGGAAKACARHGRLSSSCPVAGVVGIAFAWGRSSCNQALQVTVGQRVLPFVPSLVFLCIVRVLRWPPAPERQTVSAAPPSGSGEEFVGGSARWRLPRLVRDAVSVSASEAFCCLGVALPARSRFGASLTRRCK